MNEVLRSKSSLIAWGFFASLLVFRGATVWTASPEYLSAIVPDDAFYYLGIAREIAAGHGSTFDGVTATNGYHPLWLMICAFIAQMLKVTNDPGSLLLLLRTVLTFQLLCGVGTAALLARAIAPTRPGTILLPLVLGLPWCIYAMTDGMESGVVVLSIAATCWIARRHAIFSSDRADECFAFGAILSMALLARLDAALLCISLGVVALIRRERPTSRDLARWSLWAVPVLITFAVYMVINKLSFDSLAPISGKLKSTFPHPVITRAHLLRFLPQHALTAFMALAYLSCRRRLVSTDADLARFCAGLVLFTTLLSVNAVFFMDWAVHQWHFSALWPCAFFVLGAILSVTDFRSWMTTTLAVILVVASLSGQWSFLHGRASRAFQVQSWQAASWARDHLPATERIGMSDCGAFGFWRGGGVVNLDGVVNNGAYQDALAGPGGIAGYAQDRNLAAIAHHAVDARRVAPGYGQYDYRVYSHLHGKPGGSLVLHEGDELFRSPPYNDGSGEKVFVIWKLQTGHSRR